MKVSVSGVGKGPSKGMAERKNCHLLEVARCLLKEMGVPPLNREVWSEAVMTAAFLIFYVVTPILQGALALHVLLGKAPHYHRLRVFGCLCLTLMPYVLRTSGHLSPQCLSRLSGHSKGSYLF